MSKPRTKAPPKISRTLWKEIPPMPTMTFLVSIKFPPVLQKNIIRNYVTMAMKKYHKLTNDRPGGGYFDNMASPIFSIKEIDLIDDDDTGNIRKIVEQINQVKKHLKNGDLVEQVRFKDVDGN